MTVSNVKSVSGSQFSPLSLSSQFRPAQNGQTLIAFGEGSAVRAAGEGLKWTMKAAMRQAAKYGLKVGSEQAFKELIATQSVQVIERLSAAELQNSKVVMAAIWGMRIQGRAISDLVVGSTVSLASLGASAAALKQVGGSLLSEHKNNWQSNIADGLASIFFWDVRPLNNEDESKQIKYNAIYNKLLPQYQQAEREMKLSQTQKTRAGSMSFGSNHGSQGDGEIRHHKLTNGAKNIVPLTLKKRGEEYPATCIMTVTSEYKITKKEELFGGDGKTVQFPVAQNKLKFSAKLESNRIGVPLTVQLQVGNVRTGILKSPTVTNHVSRLNYVNVKIEPTVTISTNEMTLHNLAQLKTSFDKYVDSQLSFFQR